MATKEQIFGILAGASGSMSRPQLAEEVGEIYQKYETQLQRWIKSGDIEDVGDHHYVLTEKGREASLQTQFKEIDKLPGSSEETLGTTEYQQFIRLGKNTGITPLALIMQTAEHIWAGGEYKDLKWVLQGMHEMGIRQDLRGRWFHSWRSYLKQPIPEDVAVELLSGDSKKPVAGSEAAKLAATGKRDYILTDDSAPLFVGAGLGDLDYKDALDLSKVRIARGKEGSHAASPGTMADEITKIFRAFRETMGDKAEGKSYVIKPDEEGYQVEEVKGNQPIIVGQPNQAKSGPSFYVDSDGKTHELAPGQPVVIIKEPPKTAPSAGTHYLINEKTGEVKEVAANQPVVIIRESSPQNQATPIQWKDKDGNPMVMDLSTLITLESHRDGQRRNEEAHQVKMEIAKGFLSLMKTAESAASHMGDEGGE